MTTQLYISTLALALFSSVLISPSLYSAQQTRHVYPSGSPHNLAGENMAAAHFKWEEKYGGTFANNHGMD